MPTGSRNYKVLFQKFLGNSEFDTFTFHRRAQIASYFCPAPLAFLPDLGVAESSLPPPDGWACQIFGMLIAPFCRVAVWALNQCVPSDTLNFRHGISKLSGNTDWQATIINFRDMTKSSLSSIGLTIKKTCPASRLLLCQTHRCRNRRVRVQLLDFTPL